MLISAAQIRAGRVLIGMPQKALAARAGISEPTMKRIESDRIGPGRSSAASVQAVLDVLQAEGIEFLFAGQGKGAGVRLAVG